jgi:hypothetical protein
VKGDQQRLEIEDLTQFLKSSNGDAGPGFLLQLFAEERIQHPLGHGQLQSLGKSHHQDGGAGPSQVADDFDLDIIEGVMAIVDFRRAQIMSSMRRC